MKKCIYCSRELKCVGGYYAPHFEECTCGGREAEAAVYQAASARVAVDRPRAVGDLSTGFSCSCCGRKLNFHYLGGIESCSSCEAAHNEKHKEDYETISRTIRSVC